MPKTQNVNIAEAKGRPMLHWVGKRPLDHVTAYPAQRVETFNPTDEETNAQGLLFHGDNKDVLAWLLAHGYRGKVDLVYIDPPFDSGADYIRRVELRDGSGSIPKLSGESYTLGEQIQYTDIWANDTYLQFMYERLLLLKELLSEDGSIYLHSDSHRTHHLRCLMDEVFGAENFKNDIVWQRFNYRADGNKFGTVHDTILFYTQSSSYAFKKPYVSYKSSYIRSHFKPDEDGRLHRLDNLTAPSHGKPGKPLYFGDQLISPPPGTMWRYSQENLNELWEKGYIVVPEEGVPQVKRYLDEIEGQAVHSLWTRISSINSQAIERTDYPTQKPEALLERILATSSGPGDLVLDCFVGAGTTAAVAQRMGRQWIASDINKGAVQTTSKRLQTIIREQIDAGDEPRQATLDLTEDDEESPPPAALSFSVYKVNDYDLQLQHNEAVNIVKEHVGIDPLKTDAFFDGTRGKKLVKIVPFTHPLTPLDLQLIKDELANRPQEERDVLVVCLGQESTVDPWLEEYNRRRPINKITVIELRTDEKYGKFLVHQPAQAQVRIERQDDELVVEIEDFISPTIVERLEMDTPLFKAKIPDWRAMVDVVMIDADYDGGPDGSGVFDIDLSDVPARKDDLVAGRYTLAVPEGETTVAVKIIDMLGEEVLVTEMV